MSLHVHACECICACLCVCAWVCVHACLAYVCVHGCVACVQHHVLPLLCSTLLFETEFLAESSTYLLAKFGGPWMPRDPGISAPPWVRVPEHAGLFPFLSHGFWTPELRPPCLLQCHVTNPVSHLSSPPEFMLANPSTHEANVGAILLHAVWLWSPEASPLSCGS